MRIRFLASAEKDITTAIDWYLERSEPAAERFADQIDDALQKIALAPDRFPSWDTLHRFLLLRRFPYYIAYRVESEYLLIVAVRHTSHDADDWTLRS